jgi:hypothetical protein
MRSQHPDGHAGHGRAAGTGGYNRIDSFLRWGNTLGSAQVCRSNAVVDSNRCGVGGCPTQGRRLAFDNRGWIGCESHRWERSCHRDFGAGRAGTAAIFDRDGIGRGYNRRNTKEPLTGTEPMPLLMEAEVAPVDVQVRVEELPTIMVVGEADILTVGLAAQILIAKLPNIIVPTTIIINFLAILPSL